MELKRIYIQTVNQNMVDIDLNTFQFLSIITHATDSDNGQYVDTHVFNDSKGVYLQFFIRHELNDELISIITQHYGLEDD
jgi:hypothetical protein